MTDADLIDWLDAHALALDTGTTASAGLLPRLAAAGLLARGVAVAQGGAGGDLGDAVEAVALLARHSLTAAWVLTCQHSFIGLLLAASNIGLREYLLPALLEGTQAGCVPGLGMPGPISAALQAHDTGRGWRLQGELPEVSNLMRDGHLLAAPAVFEGSPSLVLLSSDQDGLHKAPWADLPAARGACTANVAVTQVYFREDELLHGDAQALADALRPTWLALQAGLGLGLAEAALLAVSQAAREAGEPPSRALASQQAAVAQARRGLLDGLRLVRAFTPAGPLLRWREHNAELASTGVALEAAGAHHRGEPRCAQALRRQREAQWLAERWLPRSLSSMDA